MPPEAATISPSRAPETAGAGSRRTASGSRARRAASRKAAGAPHAERELPDHVVIITGLSGAGKTQASKLFEDIGYYCVDNLPPALLGDFLELRRAEPQRYRRAALVVDIRAGDPAPAIEVALAALRDGGVPAQVIYLEADPAALVARFSETRHRHPIASDGGVQASIAEEQRRLAHARVLASAVVDTTGLSIGQLRERLLAVLGDGVGRTALTIDFVTFGFKFGLPLDADLVFDVRFLTNPHYVPDLRPLSGLEPPVREYVLGQPPAERFLQLVEEVIELTRPAYLAEGKARLTVALGCTGGYHRSIALAEELAARLERSGRGPVSVFHRELER